MPAGAESSLTADQRGQKRRPRARRSASTRRFARATALIE